MKMVVKAMLKINKGEAEWERGEHNLVVYKEILISSL